MPVIWKHTLRLADVFHNEAMTLPERAAAIVARIKKLPVYDENDFTIYDVVEGLESAEDAEEFDGWWDEFYGWANANRVWVVTR